jgi:hypothetical protein
MTSSADSMDYKSLDLDESRAARPSASAGYSLRTLIGSCGVTAAVAVLIVYFAMRTPPVRPGVPPPGLSSNPVPPVYPDRWAVTARFEFTDMAGNPAGAGELREYVDSIAMLFRADDLYFAGTGGLTTTAYYDCLISSERKQIYARLENGTMTCSIYPGKPTALSKNWVAEMCTFMSVVYHGEQPAYRWRCHTDVVFWELDTDPVTGDLVYQFTQPQPGFNVTQKLWYSPIQTIDEFDPSVFQVQSGWRCP